MHMKGMRFYYSQKEKVDHIHQEKLPRITRFADFGAYDRNYHKESEATVNTYCF